MHRLPEGGGLLTDRGDGELLWEPSEQRRRASALGRYLEWLAGDGRFFGGYEDLWRWSVADLPGFWRSVWEYFEVAPECPEVVLTEAVMPGAKWFPGASLNYAGHALRRRGGDPAVVSVSQTRPATQLSWDQLADAVARVRIGLRRRGVGPGHRVAAYLPNVAETIVAFLATASLGAVWSSCAPEFGVRSVVDRFAQIEPTLLLATDGYRYGERVVDRREQVAEIRAALPTLEGVVGVPYLGDSRLPGAESWADLLAEPGPLEVEPVPFDHPLYVLYSSGTTGKPKPIVHGHGGILLEHLKALALQGDIGPADRFLWFTTTGWMMWNFLVSGLLVGSTVVCFDGDPGYPDLLSLWALADEHDVSYFGTSAPYLMACRRAGVRPGADLALGQLRSIGSTGAPLPAEGFRWAYRAVERDLQLASISGGTDVCTAFVGASPLHPVRAGVIPCRYLGAAVASFSPEGRPLVGRTGELVVTAPMPSMPVGLWGDADGSRYRSTYFGTFPGVWHHGDWITLYEDGSCVISGRSDATLNRGGVRLGTAELYAVVESIDGIEDSLAVHLEDDEGGPGRLVLFVVLASGVGLDDALVERVRSALREELSPRHVPDAVEAVPAIPRTLSGKKLEVPVKRILGGAPVSAVASPDSLSDPRVLEPFAELATRIGTASPRQAAPSGTAPRGSGGASGAPGLELLDPGPEVGG